MERGFLKHLYKHILAFEPIICGYFWAIIIVLSQSVGFLRLALWVWDSWGIYIYTISHHINPSIRKGDWSSKTHFKAFHPRISGKKYDHPSSFLTSAVSQKVRDSNKNGGDSPLSRRKTLRWMKLAIVQALHSHRCGSYVWTRGLCYKVDPVSKIFIFTSILGKMIEFDELSFFQMAWNHQLDKNFWKKGG